MTTSLLLLARALQARVVVAEAVEEEPAPGQRRHGEDHVRVRRVRRDRRARRARHARQAVGRALEVERPRRMRVETSPTSFSASCGGAARSREPVDVIRAGRARDNDAGSAALRRSARSSRSVEERCGTRARGIGGPHGLGYELSVTRTLRGPNLVSCRPPGKAFYWPIESFGNHRPGTWRDSPL